MFKDQGKRGENAELQEELASNDKDKKRDAVKKVIRDMTLGKDVSGLFSAVVNNMMTPNLEVRKLVYLYLINYAKTQPELAIMAVNGFVKDASDPNPLIRALAVRTMGCIRVQSISEYLCESLRRALKDKDPYVRKTAAICVVKLHEISPDLVADQGFIESLEFLLDDANPTVVTNAVAALQEIGSRTNSKVLKLTPASVSKLLTVLNEASEWGQIYILDALATYLPSKVEEAEMMVDRVKPRLQHANSAVVLSSVKVMIKCLDQLDDNAKIASICKALGPPLVTLMSGEAENQFVALRNIQLICQKRPSVLLGEVKVFFCRYNDPIYVKMEKLDVLVMLTSEHTVDQTLAEFKEYATEIDHEFVCKAVRCIGRTAIKLEAATERCVKVLVYLIETKVNYLVQEAIIVIRDIFRKYPNKYEDIITTLCANLDTLDNAEAKAAMVWIIGEYADRIDNAAELLESFLEGFADEQHAVQLQLLTATVKLFLKRPQVAQDMVKQVLAQVTQHTDSPDLRDRGYMYWRLLSCDPEAAKAIVCGPKPTIEDDTKAIDRSLLDELVDNLSNLASVYHKRPSAFVDRKKAVLETDDYDEAEETDQADPDQPAGAETRAHPPVTDLLSLDEPTKPQGDNGTVGMDASQDALQDMLGGPRTSHIGPSAPRSQAQAGEGDLLSDLLGSSSVPSGVQELALLLSPDRAAGLCLRGGMAEQAGQAVYELHLSNTAATAIGTFNMMLNKNVYGLQVMCVDVPAVPAGGEQRVTLRMSSDASRIQVAPPAPTAGGSIAQVAIKTNAGVFYYTDTIPLAAVTVAHEVAQNDWLSQWSQMAVPSSQAAVIHLKGFAMHDADAVEAALKDRRFHIVARRPGNAGATAFYMSCRTVAQQTILWELQVLPTAARVTAKATTPGLASIVGAALEPLLQAALPIAGATHNASATMPSQPPFSSSVVGLGGGVMGAAASVPAAGAPAVDLLEGLF